MEEFIFLPEGVPELFDEFRPVASRHLADVLFDFEGLLIALN